MLELSIIIPVCNEYPHILDTVENISNEMSGMSSELILVDNTSPFVRNSYSQPVLATKIDKRKYRKVRMLAFSNYQSPWQAINIGVSKAAGKVLLFLDGHCTLPSGLLKEMYSYFKEAHYELNGPLHLPIAEKDKDVQPARYCSLYTEDIKTGVLRLELNRILPKDTSNPSIVIPGNPVCGAMITKQMFEEDLEMFPKPLGIRRGGNEIFAMVLRLMGRKSNLYTRGHVIHKTVQRQYSFGWIDMFTNQAIASFCIGGEPWLKKFCDTYHKNLTKNREPNRNFPPKAYKDLMANLTLKGYRDRLAKRAKLSVTDAFIGIQEDCPELCSRVYLKSESKKQTKDTKPKKAPKPKKTTKLSARTRQRKADKAREESS